MSDSRLLGEPRERLNGGAFELGLCQPDAARHAVLRILGNEFEQTTGDTGSQETTRRTYASAIVAVSAFEHRLAELMAAGFRYAWPPPSPHEDIEALIDDEPDEPAGYLLLAESLRASADARGELIEIAAARLEADSPELSEREGKLLLAHGDRLFGALDDVQRALPGTFTYERFLGFVREACVADADAVALADVFEPALLQVDPRELGFDPRVERPAPHTYAVHALRRLLHHPAGRFLRRLRMEIREEVEPILPLLVEHGRVDRVSHLTVTSRGGRALGALFPDLLALACYARALDRWLAAPLPRLLRLTLRWEPAALASVLAALDSTRLPSLQHLALWNTPLDAKSTGLVLDHPVIAQLTSLDLWSQIAPQRGMYETLLARRGELHHLKRLVLALHGAPAELVARFADWPAVVWADRSRAGLEEADREAIAGFPLGGFIF
ncbi:MULTISPECIES: hypothetical protein [Sorangium]|uniref:Uncharacterized protein n=1 Tax=Sorangium cellulosum TaxID=56 RepID=A0A4P2QNE1_SORCE|nr:MULTISPECIES: hypothetical protein [Sorangium]AUX31634.1 uncharacterized protein SOCE836_037650 [Sorangium cellulosum]WCQ91011.1 hypothetical protein NQZ70_03726 [Sorangium sp. Soce836]